MNDSTQKKRKDAPQTCQICYGTVLATLQLLGFSCRQAERFFGIAGVIGWKQNMVFSLNPFRWGKRKQDPRIRAVYDRLVEQARNPVFYLTYNVPDTVTGRFDLIVLHGFLFFHRMKNENEVMKEFGQEVFDIFFVDMDDSLRELGVGYQAVPKRIKKMGEAFYGRVAVYDDAVEANDPEKLQQALSRNIYPETEEVLPEARALGNYVFASVHELTNHSLEDLVESQFSFPDPAEFMSVDQ